MHNQIKAILLTTLFLISANSITSAEEPIVQYPNGIAATVDTRIITMDDLHRKLGPIVRQLQRECTSAHQFQEKLGPIAQEILDSMVNDILLVNSFMSDKKLRIPESFLENHYTKFLVEHFQGNRSNYLEYLAMEGKTDREVREQQKEEVIIGFLRGRMRRSEATISPAKIKKYYEDNLHNFIQKEEIHLRQIVLKNDDTPVQPILPSPSESSITDEIEIATNISDIEAKNTKVLDGNNLDLQPSAASEIAMNKDIKQDSIGKVQKVIGLLKKGEPFAEIAKQFSEDGMEKSGGDLGWISRSDIRKELADVAFSLNKNQFSDPIVLNNYTFILFIEDKKIAGQIPLTKVSENIEKILADEHAKQAEKQYVQKLRKKAHIKYYL